MARVRPLKDPPYIKSPGPRASLIQGFPLGSREENIAHAVKLMRERAMGIFDRTDPASGLDIDSVGADLETYADLIDTLIEHGTNYFHREGCRCDWCCEGARQYWEKVNKRRALFELSLLEDEL